MNEPIIEIENLSKHYKIRGGRASGNLFSLREAFSNSVQSLTHRLRRGAWPRGGASDFWALRDINFEIEQGRVVGLVGRNGAGKSTLLKILSRIVDPTSGAIRMRGRVASLLEVGTGFHVELSGRENIYLNGAILGMRRREIQRKFDEIVAFSEVEKFLDTPVKRYSSGMYVRLAFAVAAHLEPEILIVDEVLAVGDYAFQKKCLGKMRDVASGEGRTVIFVSHNMGTLNQLCDDGVLLEKGRITMSGPIHEVVNHYMKLSSEKSSASARFAVDPSKPGQFHSVEVLGENGELASDFTCDDPIRIRVQYEVRKPVSGRLLTLYLQNQEGTRVLHSDIRDLNSELNANLGVGVHNFDLPIPPRLLGPSTYLVTVSSGSRFGGVIDHRHDCCEFTLRDLANQDDARPGVLGVRIPWNHSAATRVGSF